MEIQMVKNYKDAALLTFRHHNNLFPLFLMPCQNAQRLFRHIYLVCNEENSTQRHFESLFSLLALLSIELATEEVVVDLIRLALALQVQSVWHCLYRYD